MLLTMKGGSGQVQTVSIIDTISELASNHGDRAKITQVSRSSRISASIPSSSTRPSSQHPSSLSITSSSTKYPQVPPPPPLNSRHPVMSVPSNFLATNINISQMSLPAHNAGDLTFSTVPVLVRTCNDYKALNQVLGLGTVGWLFI